MDLDAFNSVDFDIDNISVGSLDHFFPLDDFVERKKTLAPTYSTAPNLRVVSTSHFDSMLKKTNKATPYDSLKDLVELKKKNSEKRSPVEIEAAELPPIKKIKFTIEESNFALHKACCDPSKVDEIANLVTADPSMLSVRYKVSTEKTVYNYTTQKVETKTIAEDYQYPLNIAIKNRLSRDTIMLLFTSAPKIVGEKDGIRRESTIHILLRYMPEETYLLNCLLLASSQVKTSTDVKNNTLLHTACMYGAPLEAIQSLYNAYPEALKMRNFHRETPLHLAQRKACCAEDISHFFLHEW